MESPFSLQRLKVVDEPPGRVLVTGAGGWIGREVVSTLKSVLPEAMVMAVGRRERVVHLRSGGCFRVESVNIERIRKFEPEWVVHCAFVTREFEALLGPIEFERQNMELISSAAKFAGIETVRRSIVAGSGASLALPQSSYGSLKVREWDEVRDKGLKVGAHATMVRLWSVTGLECTKPAQFAFYDLIRQALFSPVVTIAARGSVYRRYMDARDVFAVAFLASIETKEELVLDSFGPLVELHDLATEILAVLDIDKEIVRPNLRSREEPDAYYSTSSLIETLATRVDIRTKDLAQQIKIGCGVLAATH